MAHFIFLANSNVGNFKFVHQAIRSNILKNRFDYCFMLLKGTNT